jgi:hypothetical protein
MFLRFNTHFWKTVRRVRSVIASLLLAIAIGALLIAFIEQLPLGEALYFSFITGLTIGYGGIVAATAIMRIISVLPGVTGILFTGLIVTVAVHALLLAVQDVHGDD